MNSDGASKPYPKRLGPEMFRISEFFFFYFGTFTHTEIFGGWD
jgi:hypothetical protein